MVDRPKGVKSGRELKMMFSSIAKSYDRMNHIMSLGADIRWRKRAAMECVDGYVNPRVLDAATGTGDLALAIAKEARSRGGSADILGLDFNEDMLNVAKEKIARSGFQIELVVGNTQSMNLDGSSFDVVTTGFALRNFDNLKSFVEESYRVLRPGGRIVFLDVARPDVALSRLFQFYYFKIVPVIVVGTRYSPEAYQYLFNSLWIFDKNNALELVKRAGFRNANIKNLSLGAAFMIVATKPRKKAKR